MNDENKVVSTATEAACASPVAEAGEIAAPTAGMATGKTPAILTRNLTKQYGTLMALDNLSLQLESGDVFGFIGPNGAGKSTTMKILAGLLSPTSGQAMVLGKDVTHNGDFVRRNIGYMPDVFGVYEDLKVSEYLEFFASAYGIARRTRKKIVGDVLELTDLSYKRDAFVDALSRGMQQRLGLARVLVHDPPVLLLDEPASGLDPRARIEMRELLKELRRLGKTILVSSHILSELDEFCNKLGIIERGKLIVSGTREDLMARAQAHPVICVQVVDEPERAMAVLKTDPRVDRVEMAGLELLVTLHDPEMHHHFLIEQLVAGNVQVHSVAPRQLKLEDVFRRLGDHSQANRGRWLTAACRRGP
ncbi:MAG TPA: ABC transporter ATP-binding protein [Tepidisphaeraceae bacterium]|nr:ABC transporter ATP-binding protein [Tepidisphaeraceae bacterium]